jgi:hypothetical protein
MNSESKKDLKMDYLIRMRSQTVIYNYTYNIVVPGPMSLICDRGPKNSRFLFVGEHQTKRQMPHR